MDSERNPRVSSCRVGLAVLPGAPSSLLLCVCPGKPRMDLLSWLMAPAPPEQGRTQAHSFPQHRQHLQDTNSAPLHPHHLQFPSILAKLLAPACRAHCTCRGGSRPPPPCKPHLRDLNLSVEPPQFSFCMSWVPWWPSSEPLAPSHGKRAGSAVQLFKIKHFFRWFPGHQLLFSLRNTQPTALAGCQ